MERKLSTSEILQHSTVRIECLEAGAVVSTGTGFFFGFCQETDGRNVPAIVTNKHVVEGASHGRLILTLTNEKNVPLDQRYSFDIFDFEKSWIPHPDGNTDLCVLLIGPILHDLEAKGLYALRATLDPSLIPSESSRGNLVALEDILMIGYPNGLWDSVNNLPIMRKGVTATHPNKDYNGAKEFMIDAACFPGSSGSPVFLYNEGAYSDGRGNVSVGSRLFLLGILYAGPQFTAQGDIHVVNIPTNNRQVVLSRIPNNLGIVIKSEKLLEFEPIIQNMLKI